MKRFGLKHKHRLVAAAVVAVALIAGLTHRRAIETRRDRITAAQASIVTLRGADQRAELLVRRAALLERSAALDGAAPQASEIAGFINALKRDCESIGIPEQTWSIGEPRSMGEHAGIPVDLSFVGSFPGVHDLLGRIDAYERIARIEKLVFIAEPDRPSDQLSVSIRIDAMASADDPMHSAAGGQQ